MRGLRFQRKRKGLIRVKSEEMQAEVLEVGACPFINTPMVQCTPLTFDSNGRNEQIHSRTCMSILRQMWYSKKSNVQKDIAQYIKKEVNGPLSCNVIVLTAISSTREKGQHGTV